MIKDITKNLVGQLEREDHFEKFYAFYSTTITLFSDVMKGVGRNPKLVYYRDEKGRKCKFITNNWDITAEEVALIYKYRWTMETTLLLNVIRVLSKSRKAFSTVSVLIRIHLISHLDLMWVVTEGRCPYTKRRISRNKSPATIQLSLL